MKTARFLGNNALIAIYLFILSTILPYSLICSHAAQFASPTGNVAMDANFGVHTPSVQTIKPTGANTISIPIEVPPGRNDLRPELVLSYNSYFGNGPFGVGWNLNQIFIQRSTKNGLDYNSEIYVAVNKGETELLPRDDWGVNVFGAKKESTFTKYYFKGDLGWEAINRNGDRYFFGQNINSRQTDPNDSSRIFRWCLDKIIDTNNNILSMIYEKENGQVYLTKIEYTGSANLLPTKSVTFNYEEILGGTYHAIDIIDYDTLKGDYTNIIPGDFNGDGLHDFIRQEKGDWDNDNVKTAELFTNKGDGTFEVTLVSGYEGLKGDYTNIIPGDYNGDGKTDFIRQEKGHWDNDDVGTAHVFFSNGDQTFHAELIPGYKGLKGDLTNIIPGDYNGDGKTDFIRQEKGDWDDDDVGTAHLFTSNGDGSFEVTLVPGYKGLKGDLTNIIPGDYNGDGKTDFIRQEKGHWDNDDVGTAHVFFSNGDKTFHAELIPGYKGLKGDLTNIIPGDYNGDGKTDFIRQEKGDWDDDDVGTAHVFYSNGDGSFDAYLIPGHKGLKGDYTYIIPGDFNGDGLSDFIRHERNGWDHDDIGTAHIFYSMGERGNFSASPVPGYQGLKGTYTNLILGDYNGDGITDFIRQEKGKWDNDSIGTAQVFISRNDTPDSYKTHFMVKNTRRLKSIDVVSNGQTVRSYSLDYTQSPTTTRSLLTGIHHYGADGSELSHETFEYEAIDSYYVDLLTKSTSSIGKTTDIRYEMSSAYENRLLPFNVAVVSSVTTNDGLGIKNERAYHYDGGLYDFLDRDFRGFAKVTETNCDSITNTYSYHQDEYRSGLIYEVVRREFSNDPTNPGKLISKEQKEWQTHFLNEPENSIGFVKLVKNRTEFEGKEDLYKEALYSYDVDTEGKGADVAGFVTKVVLAGTSAETITKSYAHDNLDEWLWRQTNETVEGSLSGKVRETNYTYFKDGTGNLREKIHWLSNNLSENPKITYDYDTYGNVTAEQDARGHITTIAYESLTHTFAQTITKPAVNGVSHVERHEAYDYRFGKPTRTIDENGGITINQYDQFGRLKQIDTPDGGQTLFVYDDDNFPHSITKRVKESDGNYLDTATWYDGLGRKIRTAAYGHTPIGGPRKTIVTRWDYDALGRVANVIGPFFGIGDGTLDYNGLGIIPLEHPYRRTIYDALDRPVEV